MLSYQLVLKDIVSIDSGYHLLRLGAAQLGNQLGRVSNIEVIVVANDSREADEVAHVELGLLLSGFNQRQFHPVELTQDIARSNVKIVRLAPDDRSPGAYETLVDSALERIRQRAG